MAHFYFNWIIIVHLLKWTNKVTISAEQKSLYTLTQRINFFDANAIITYIGLIGLSSSFILCNFYNMNAFICCFPFSYKWWPKNMHGFDFRYTITSFEMSRHVQNLIWNHHNIKNNWVCLRHVQNQNHLWIKIWVDQKLRFLVLKSVPEISAH